MCVGGGGGCLGFKDCCVIVECSFFWDMNIIKVCQQGTRLVVCILPQLGILLGLLNFLVNT